MKKGIITFMLLTFCMLAFAQNYKLTGKLGTDQASFTLKKTGNSVKGKITRCPYCIPIKVEGEWKGNNITLSGSSEAGSQMSYEMTVDGTTVKGTESLWAEGEEEKSEISMELTKSASTNSSKKSPSKKVNKKR